MNNSYIDKAVAKNCVKLIIKSMFTITIILVLLYFSMFKYASSMRYITIQNTVDKTIKTSENFVKQNIYRLENEKIWNGDKVVANVLRAGSNLTDLWIKLKCSYVFFYIVLPIMLLANILFIIKYLWYYFNKKHHPIYKNLHELGDVERLAEIINREISGDVFNTKLNKNVLTRNWIIVKTKKSTEFIPYNMIIWAYKNNKWNIDNIKEDAIFEDTYYVKLYLLNGKKYVVKLNKEEADSMEKILKDKLVGVSFKFSVYKWVVWINEKKHIKQKWKSFVKNNSNIYFYLQSDNNDYSNDNYNSLSDFNAALKLRGEALEQIEHNLIVLDGYVLDGDDFPTEINDKVMIPVIDILKNMGADIISEEDDLIAARVWGNLINISVDSKIVSVKNKNYTLSSKICVVDEVIYAPIDFVSDILNSEIKCNKENLHIDIKEKEKTYSKEQLNYAYSIAAILSLVNDEKINILGGKPRNKENCIKTRKTLSEWWSIENRNDFFNTFEELKGGMHNCVFMEIRDKIENMNEIEFEKVLKEAQNYEEQRDLEVVRKYSRELGEKGIIGWDLSRAISITGYAYLAGFINYEEATDIVMDISGEVQATFNSWEDIGKNYLIGFEFWSGEYPDSFTSQLSKRWEILNELRKNLNSPYNTLNWKMDLDAQKGDKI